MKESLKHGQELIDGEAAGQQQRRDAMSHRTCLLGRKLCLMCILPLFKLSTDSRCLRLPNSLIVLFALLGVLLMPCGCRCMAKESSLLTRKVGKGHCFAVLM